MHLLGENGIHCVSPKCRQVGSLYFQHTFFCALTSMQILEHEGLERSVFLLASLSFEYLARQKCILSFGGDCRMKPIQPILKESKTLYKEFTVFYL